jgi:hypothetical protein
MPEFLWNEAISAAGGLMGAVFAGRLGEEFDISRQFVALHP